MPPYDFHNGLSRLAQFLAQAGLVLVKRTGRRAGVKSRRSPKPLKFGPSITCWRVEDIGLLMEEETKNAG